MSATRLHNRAAHRTRRDAAQRLSAALEALMRQGTGAVTVTELCRVAVVSRNSLYRYHVPVLNALREHQRHGPKAAQRKARKASERRREEINILRDQAAKLAALVDHYFAAWQEASSMLQRRERELADLRKSTKPKVVSIRN